MIRLLRVACAVLALLVAAGPAHAQRLPADTLHALVARMRAVDLVTDSLGERLDADIAARRITLRSTLARRQHEARIEALTGVRPMAFPFGGPMMSFDGATGPTQAEWQERFMRSGLVAAAQVDRLIDGLLGAMRPSARDSMWATRTPVPIFGEMYSRVIAQAEIQHPDRITAWAADMARVGVAVPGARERLLDSARVRMLGPVDFAAALAPRWAPSAADTVTAEGLAAQTDDLHRCLAARGLLDGPSALPGIDTLRRETSWGPGEARHIVSLFIVLREGGRAYRSERFPTIIRREEPVRFAAPGTMPYSGSYTGVFNRMLRDRLSDVRLATLPDGSVLAVTSAQARAVARMQSPEFALMRPLLATLPDSTRRLALRFLPDSTRRIVLTADPDSAALATLPDDARLTDPPKIDWGEMENSSLLEPLMPIGLAPDNGAFLSGRVDTLVARLRGVGWFVATGLPPDALYEQDINPTSLFRALVGPHQINMEDAEHGSMTPYGDIVEALGGMSRGGFAPTVIKDRFELGDSDSSFVSWTAQDRPVRVAYQQKLGDRYDHDAVRAIMRAANTAARGGRFRYAPRQYAYVWLPEGAEPILSAEGLFFEAP